MSQNWAETFQQYHPGVTTMWLSGLGIRVFSWYRGISSDELLAFESLSPGVLHQAVTAGVVSLAVGISLGIVLIYLLLAKLTERKLALSAAFLMALDPFHITHSKTLHLDAIMSVLMLITLLILLFYRQQKSNRILIAAGIFTGFSILTKTPTALLIPIGTLLIAGSEKLMLPEENAREQWQARLKWLGVVIQKLVIWGLATTATFFIFWPAMWSAPQDMLALMRDSVLVHALNPHPNLVFFNGSSTLEDPGAIYYGAVFLWRTTLITFPFILIGLGSLFWELKRKKMPYRRTLFWIVLFGVLFLLQMMASAKKVERYILPVFLILDVAAAFGLVQLGYFVVGRLKSGNSNMVWGLLVGGFLIIQAGLVLPHHPYYSNKYNLLFGGIQQAQDVLGLQTQAEGIDLAGQYLNTLPESSQINAAIFSFGTDMLIQHFGGNIMLDDENPAPNTDYRIYYNNQITRGLGGPGWIDAWESDRLREPEHVIIFDDIPFVWIYKTPDAAVMIDGRNGE